MSMRFFRSAPRGLWIVLLVALGARLYHIDFPVSGYHAWRQSDTAAMARNFYENGFDLLHPQVDWGGNTPGYVESEFPIYSYVVALLYAAFSPRDLWGRLLSVLCALATILALYKLVRKYSGESVALWSAFVYAIVPLNIYYTRAFMPEAAMLMFSVLGVYWFSEWMDRGGLVRFMVAVAGISLAILIKLPALYLGVVLPFLAWMRHSHRTFLQWRLWTFAVLALLPAALWYRHAHHIWRGSGLTFGIWGFGSDKWGGDGSPPHLQILQ